MPLYSRILLMVGLCFIFYVAGTAIEYFKFSAPIDRAFEGGKALMENLQGPKDLTVSKYDIEHSISAGKAYWDQSRAYNGYTLTAFRSFQGAYLIDMEGNIVHRWTLAASSVRKHFIIESNTYICKAQLFPNGDLIVIIIDEGNTPYGYGIVKLDKDSNVIWSYRGFAHHDFYVDQENGNIYTLTHAFINTAPSGLEDFTYPMLADSITALSPEGKELYSFPLLEAFKGTPYEMLLYTDTGNEKSWDLLHANSIMKLEKPIADKFPLFKPGQLLVSFRSISTIAVVDPTTHKVVWAANGLWRGQHSASFLPNGHILLFDNRGYELQDKEFSRILEIDPKTLGVTWSYRGPEGNPFFTFYRGIASRLPNGNTLIAQSTNGKLVEVTSQGDVAWSYEFYRGSVTDADGKESAKQHSFILDASRYSAKELPFLDSH